MMFFRPNRRIPFTMFVLFIALANLGLSRFSCDESLPPHNEPGTLFNGAISARYVSKNQTLLINLTVKNIFDETLQDTANLTGSIQIVMSGAPEFHRAITIDRSRLTSRTQINPGSNVLTVNSGDSLTFSYQWDFTTDDNVRLPSDVFVKVPDTQFAGRFVSLPVSFLLSASIQVFTRTSLVTLFPATFVFVYDYSA